MPDADLEDGLSDYLAQDDIRRAIPLVARRVDLVKHQQHHVGLTKVATARAGARAQGYLIDDRHSPQSSLSTAKPCVVQSREFRNLTESDRIQITRIAQFTERRASQVFQETRAMDDVIAITRRFASLDQGPHEIGEFDGFRCSFSVRWCGKGRGHPRRSTLPDRSRATSALQAARRLRWDGMYQRHSRTSCG